VNKIQPQEIASTTMKHCTRCKEWKPITEFHIGSRNRGSKPRSTCKVCRKEVRQANAQKINEQGREYYKANSSRRKAVGRAYREANPDRVKEANRQYVEHNREKVRENQRRWREANVEYLREWQHTYRATNAIKYKEYYRCYRIANPDKEVSKRHTRRARLKAAHGEFSQSEWRNLCNFYQNTCLRCGVKDVSLTPDHIVPLSCGGSNKIENIQPLCLNCNLKKGTKTVDYRKQVKQ